MRHTARITATFLVLAAASATAQVDITANGKGPYLDLARGATWAGTGRGALNNYFIFSPMSPDLNTCVFVRNYDTPAHTFTISVYHTGDSRVTGYAANSLVWAQDGITYAGVTVNGASAAGNVWSSYYSTAGAARVAVAISGGSSTGTADLYIVQTAGSSCAGGAGGLAPNNCAYYANINLPSLAAATNSEIIAPNSSVRKVHVCYVVLTLDSARDLTFTSWSGSSCTTTQGNSYGPFVASQTVRLDVPSLSLDFTAGYGVCINVATGPAKVGGIVGYSVY